MKAKYLFLTLLLCNITAKAQDLYLPITTDAAGTTEALFRTFPAGEISFPGNQTTDNYRGNINVVFDGSGNLIFTGGTMSNQAFPSLGGIGAVPAQIFALPGECQGYCALSDILVAPHNNRLIITDVSTGATLLSTSVASWMYFGAVAAPLNADGTRYIYYFTSNPIPNAAPAMTISRYIVPPVGGAGSATLDNTYSGAVSTYLVGQLHIYPDGQSIGYFDNNGHFNSYNVSTGVQTIYTNSNATISTSPSFTAGVAGYTQNINRQWYISNGSALGYVTEGSAASWTTMSTTYGIHSDLSFGHRSINNNLFCVQGTPPAAGQVIQFNPGGGYLGAISNAYVSTLNPDGSSYYFGNLTPGDNINAYGTPAAITSINLDGVFGGTTTPANLTLCNVADGPLLLGTLATGAIHSSSVKVEEGTFASGTFTPNGTTFTSSFTSTTAPDVSLTSLFPSLNGYAGVLRITTTVNGSCNSATEVQLYNLILTTPVTGLSFTVDGKKQTSPTAPPALIWQCNNNTALTMIPTITTGTLSGYTIEIEKGTYSDTTFTPTSSQTTGNIPATSLPSSVNLYTLFPGGYLTTPVGYIRVTLTTAGPCIGAASSVQIFGVQDVNSLINFSMVGPYTCTSNQSRNVNPTFASFTQPVATPPCDMGWLGATSCGIATPTALVPGAYTNYTVVIDQYDATGTFESEILNTTKSGTIPAVLGLNSLTSGYFINKYAGIKNSNTFKVTVSITTVTCGTLSNYSWFKIIDGGTAGTYWRPSGTAGVPTTQSKNDEFSFYPNPATSTVNFTWTSTAKSDATLEIVDIVGKVLYHGSVNEQAGQNRQTVDVSNLTPGIYVYKLSCEQGLKTGKFQKL